MDWGVWEDAHALADKGQWEPAAQALRQHPAETAAYYYNLGTLNYHAGRVGQAVAYLEKADHLQPHDLEIQQNLRIAQAAAGHLMGSLDKLDPASSWAESMADRVPLTEVRGTLGLVGLILALLWIRGYLRNRNLKNTLMKPAALLAAGAFALTAALYVSQREAEQHPPAYCLDHLVLRSGPGDNYLELGSVEAGVKLRLLGPSAQEGPDTWVQVRYSDSGVGWVRQSALLKI